MSLLALNLLLAAVWMLLTARFTFGGMLSGLAVGFLAIWAGRPFLGSAGYVRAARGLAVLLAIYAWKLVTSNVQLARDALRPDPRFDPGFLRIGTGDLDRVETVVFANLLSLTPGTVTVDADERGHAIYIHTLYARDVARARDDARRYARLIRRATARRTRIRVRR